MKATFLAVSVLAGAIALRAQDPPAPTFRGGVDIVHVDVSVPIVAFTAVDLPPRPAAPEAQGIALETVLARAAAYAAVFVDRFSNVVAEEHYAQAVRRPAGSGLQIPQRRELRSDLIVVKDDTPFGWTVLRDVFEVDGKPVRDREERLTKLLAQPSASARLQATRIADESARYNIGPGVRTTNTPELSILFLQQSLQPRFTFRLGSRERSMGERVWIVEYRESSRPTLVRGEKDSDLPASGRFWIDVETGQVLQAEIDLRPPAARWTLTTVFKLDERIGIAVPVEMREYYQWWATEMTGTATYGRFRSFAVTTSEEFGQ